MRHLRQVCRTQFESGSFIAFGQLAGEDETNRTVTFKVTGPDSASVRACITPFVLRLIDVRE